MLYVAIWFCVLLYFAVVPTLTSDIIQSTSQSNFPSMTTTIQFVNAAITATEGTANGDDNSATTAVTVATTIQSINTVTAVSTATDQPVNIIATESTANGDDNSATMAVTACVATTIQFVNTAVSTTSASQPVNITATKGKYIPLVNSDI